MRILALPFDAAKTLARHVPEHSAAGLTLGLPLWGGDNRTEILWEAAKFYSTDSPESFAPSRLSRAARV